jgi:hypothetical protein
MSRLRYSGASLGYQLASVVAGGPAPLIAAWLFGTYHSPTAIAVYHQRGRDRADDRLHRQGYLGRIFGALKFLDRA